MYNKTIHLDGMAFTQSGRPYYYNSAKRIYLHRYLWEKENGSIPEGYEIHHKDGNSENNEIQNLELVSISHHKALHSELSWDDERREWARNNLAENARPAASLWHKSSEGREWHKKHYETTKDKLHAEAEFKCEMCGDSFVTQVTGKNRFCSNKCKSKWRRKSGVDDVTKVCGYCGNEYQSNKYSKSSFCSKSCSMKHRHSAGKLKDSPNLQE